MEFEITLAKLILINKACEFRYNSVSTLESLIFMSKNYKPKPEEDKEKLPPGFNPSTGFTETVGF